MKEIHVSHYLEDNIGHARKVISVASLVAFASAIGCFTIGAPVIFFGLALLSTCVAAMACRSLSRWQSGADGEVFLRIHLRNLGLSDLYTAYYSVPVTYNNGNKADIDCLLVGPDGIHAFEIKHHPGHIMYRNGLWKQLKVGRRGGLYFGGLKNPSGQLSSAIKAFKNRLEERTGTNSWITGTVVFTNPLAAIDVEGLKWINAVLLRDLGSVIVPGRTVPARVLAEIEKFMEGIAISEKKL